MDITPRPLPWPASRLAPGERVALAFMAELTGTSVCRFVRDAVLAHMAAEHERLFPDVANPWRPDHVDVARRAAEGGGRGG